MKTLHACIGLVGIAVGLIPGFVAADSTSAKNGKAAFMRDGCWECHGTGGQGTNAGPKLAPNPLPFEVLSSFVRNTSRQMPAYRIAVLTDKDLADIYAYLQSIPKSPDYKSLPLLAQ